MSPSSEAYLKHIVRESVQETLVRMGFTTEEPHELQADMLYLRKSRRGSDEVAKWLRRTVLTTTVSGLLYTLYAGLRITLRG